MAFIGCLLYWSGPGLGQGLVLAQALSGDQPLEPLGVMFWALGFAVGLLATLSALGLVCPAVSAFRGSIGGRFLVTMLALVLVGAMLPWLGYWDDWPLLVTSGVGLTLSGYHQPQTGCLRCGRRTLVKCNADAADPMHEWASLHGAGAPGVGHSRPLGLRVDVPRVAGGVTVGP